MLRNLPLFTFVFLVSISGLGLLMQSCGLACTEVGCVPAVRLEFIRPDGSTVTTFTATATIDGRRFAGSCDAEISFWNDGSQCAEGSLTLFDVDWNSEPSVQLELSTPDGERFSGQVQPVYLVDKNFNGPGCGECGGGSAAVTVDR